MQEFGSVHAPIITPSQSHARGAQTSANLSENQSVSEPFWGEDGFTFGDILDAVNPLKQLPIISDIYEHFAGESDVSTGSKIAGGALFGGIIGVFSAFAQNTVEETTGSSVSDHVKLALLGKSEAPQEIAKPSQNETISGVSLLILEQQAAQAPHITTAIERYTALAERNDAERLLEQLEQQTTRFDLAA